MKRNQTKPKAIPNYPFELWWSKDDQCWIAEAYDLPGCMADGKTQEDALKALRLVIELWIEVAGSEGRDVPPPSTEAPASGKFNVRLPMSLHQRLRRLAEREQVSLNEVVVSLLSEKEALSRSKSTKKKRAA